MASIFALRCFLPKWVITARLMKVNGMASGITRVASQGHLPALGGQKNEQQQGHGRGADDLGNDRWLKVNSTLA